MTSVDRTLAPVDALRSWTKKFPGAWDQYAKFRAQREELGGWPEYVYCPLAGAYAIVSEGGRRELSRSDSPIEGANDIAVMGALAAWRPTLGIYRYDDTLLDALWSTPLDGQIPIEHLYRLPEWCVYLELPGRVVFGSSILGAWAHLEYDANDRREELRLLLLDEAGRVVPVPLHLRGGTLERALGLALDEADAIAAIRAGSAVPASDPTVARTVAREIAPIVSTLLYLCSEAPELRDARGSDRRPERPRERVDKRGRPRVYGAQEPTTWEAGYRLGAALRRAQDAAQRAESERTATGRSVTPHVRRAHWHTYVLGPRADATRQTRSLRWLPPIPIGLEEGDEPVPVVRPVR